MTDILPHSINKNVCSSRKVITLLIIIVILGASIRFGLIQRNPLWLDEAMMFDYANHADFSEVMEKTKNDCMTGPIAMFLLHYNIKLLGTSEFSLRLFSCLTGILSLVFLFFLASYFMSDNYALLASGIAAISPFQVYYSVDLREYGFTFLISIISSILFVQFIQKKSFLNGLCCSFLCSFGLGVQYGIVFLVTAFVNRPF